MKYRAAFLVISAFVLNASAFDPNAPTCKSGASEFWNSVGVKKCNTKEEVLREEEAEAARKTRDECYRNMGTCELRDTCSLYDSIVGIRKDCEREWNAATRSTRSRAKCEQLESKSQYERCVKDLRD